MPQKAENSDSSSPNSNLSQFFNIRIYLGHFSRIEFGKVGAEFSAYLDIQGFSLPMVFRKLLFEY